MGWVIAKTRSISDLPSLKLFRSSVNTFTSSSTSLSREHLIRHLPVERYFKICFGSPWSCIQWTCWTVSKLHYRLWFQTYGTPRL
jgi:hypothetical protein